MSKRRISFNKRLRLKKNNPSREVYKPYLGSEFQNGLDIEDDLTSRFFIELYMKMCRGLQLRNWNRVLQQLLWYKAPKKVIYALKSSWVRFKVARAIRPSQSSNYVYILKNFSSLEGQKIFDDCYEQFVEQPYMTTLEFYKNRGYDSRYFRLAEYFYNEEPEWIIPMTLFPRINFKKSKMHLSEEPYEIDGELLKEVHEKVFKYILDLDLKQIFVPRADVMQKFGNQRYNDGGTVKYDHQRPEVSFDSSFKYQRFLTAPLTPREVWLPGKAIKQNNAFFMTLHRQFLEADEVYPSSDDKVNWERIRKFLKEGFLKFDISGFGFQYLRELLLVGNRAIQELYPCSVLDEQSAIFEQILESVQVEMPDGTVKKPPRGIGLGYYEDLKTIVMMALLRHLDPISVYGDQGLLPPFAVTFAEELQRFGFIMNWEKIDFGSSEEKTKWGGHAYTPESLTKPRLYMENIIGSFFTRHHWERKASLFGFKEHYPNVYKKVEKTLSDMYERVFGWEFFPKDSSLPFDNGGITSKPSNTGLQRLWWLREYKIPKTTLLYDTVYQTPFRLVTKGQPTFKESKEFQKTRKMMYRTKAVNDTILFDYIHPKIVYNKKDRIPGRLLPKWADFNLIVYHNTTSGALTCGLKGDEIQNAISRQVFSQDPFRARATGGYMINTQWRSSRPPSQEWIDIGDSLVDLQYTDSLFVKRADLPQNPELSEDPMYYNDNLFSHIISKVEKRKRPLLSSVSECLGNTMAEEVRQVLPSLIKRAKISHLNDIVALVEKRLEDYDKNYTINESDYGSYVNDNHYFADDIDMVD